MCGYIANTDIDWFEFLLTQQDIQEVNFWQPSGGKGFQAVPPGAPFFFRLKSPVNKIAGFGFFSRHEILPAWLAWDTFERANGAPDSKTMRKRIEKYRRKNTSDSHADYLIGCLMLIDPIFFNHDEWIDEPKDWSSNIVQGKTYDLTQGEGRRIWNECRERSQNVSRISASSILADKKGPRYGDPALIKPRLGQGGFRIAVIKAYNNACAITTEHSLPALEASHIKPFSEGGEHEVPNGLLLRSDIHRLFDKGYVTVAPDYHFEVSWHLKDDYQNGKSYYYLHGQKIHKPENPSECPNPKILLWHNQNMYLG